MLKKKLDNNFYVYSWQKKFTSKNALYNSVIFTSRATIHGKVVPTIHEKLYFIEFFQKTLKMNPKNGPIS